MPRQEASLRFQYKLSFFVEGVLDIVCVFMCVFIYTIMWEAVSF